MKNPINPNISLSYEKKGGIFNILLTFLLLVLAIFMLAPFFWMLSTSLKADSQVFEYPIRWIPKVFDWSNYAAVWTNVPFGLYYLNTIKLSVIITACQVLFSAMAAYAFAKLNFSFRNFLFMLYLTTMMIPWQSIMIPQFTIVRFLGLYDTHSGYILIQLFSAFGVFLLRQFFMTVPPELSEAAKIDGCSEWQIFWRILLPLSKAGLSTLCIFTFTYMWNDYLAPLIYINSDNLKTIQLGLANFQTEHSMDYGVMMAGTTCALLPMFAIFILGKNYFTKGIAFTGIKA